ncbi:hypothetical protein [Spirillospora sp. CA-294931]|uniref:hypothetical protein n=1 Tax=Spirillospora sp. CA-294931 TaxID=3240042 RepID=UPI003D89CAC2
MFPTRPTPSKWLSGLIEEKQTRLDEVLNHPQSDAALVKAAREYLNGANTPTGAAAVAATVIGPDDEPALLDAWTAQGGATFAACAFAEFPTLGPTWDSDRLDFRGKDEHGFLGRASARHLRSILAAAPESEYRHTVNQLAAHRRTEFQRLVVAYLAPDQTEWADEACSGPPDPDLQWIVMCVASSARHLDSFGDKIAPPNCELGLLATLAEGLGPLAAPVTIRTVEAGASAEQREALFEVLGALPSDEAMAHLIRRLDARPTLLAAMKRFPERAIRVLAERLGPSELLDGQVRAFPEAAAASLPRLDPTARAVVEALIRGSHRLPEAADDTLPPSLVNPPWTRKKPKEKPFVLAIPTPNERAISWEPGELEHWKNGTQGYDPGWYYADCERAGDHRQAPPRATEDDPIWAARVEAFRVGDLVESEQVTVLAHGPVRRARPLLRGWFPKDWRLTDTTRHPEKWMRILVARYELDALPAALWFARSKPVRFGHLLLPYLDAEVAALMADWSSRNTAAREIAAIWFGRHGHRAVPLLIPAALGKPGAAMALGRCT